MYPYVYANIHRNENELKKKPDGEKKRKERMDEVVSVCVSSHK